MLVPLPALAAVQARAGVAGDVLALAVLACVTLVAGTSGTIG